MKLYIIRHAQATHNVAEDYQIFDPPLTEHGIQQAQNIQTNFNNIDLVLTSTSIRTIQTAQNIFPKHKLYATDLLLEYNTGIPCNSRHPLDIQEKTFPDVDFHSYKVAPLQHETLWHHGVERSRRLISMLKQLNFSNVAIVSHYNFLRHIFIELLSKEVLLGNCDFYTIEL